jgi:hypothetical protein
MGQPRDLVSSMSTAGDVVKLGPAGGRGSVNIREQLDANKKSLASWSSRMDLCVEHRRGLRMASIYIRDLSRLAECLAPGGLAAEAGQGPCRLPTVIHCHIQAGCRQQSHKAHWQGAFEITSALFWFGQPQVASAILHVA